jgi:membrane-bound lytic murein transglycosylase D
MPAILEKSYAHALLFSIGLVVGGSQEPSKKPLPEPAPAAAAACTTQPPVQTPRAPTPAPASMEPRPPGGAESEELGMLRRAESELFSDVPDDARDASGMPGRGPFACSERSQDAYRRFDREASRFEQDTEGPFAGLRMPAIPVRRNPRVEKYLRYFTQNREGRHLFTTWLRRSGRYSDLISAALRRHNVPLDLVAVAFIESGLSPTAVSPAGATGMWQFMAGTARAYGLVVEAGMDERRAIWRSSDAAGRHLADLYEYFRSWDLALAAYNYGYKRVTDRIERSGNEDFWALSEQPGALPRETVLYVPKVLAVSVILNNLRAFGFEHIDLDAPVEAAEVEVPAGVRLSIVARAAGTTLLNIQALNPEYRKESTPDHGAPVHVHIPASGLARARVMLPRLIDEAEGDLTDMRVSPMFDWGRDDLTQWRTLLPQEGEAAEATPVTAATSVPALACVAPRALPPTPVELALPNGERKATAARSGPHKPPQAVGAVRTKVLRSRKDTNTASVEPARLGSVDPGRQPAIEKNQHAKSALDRLKKTAGL